MVIVPGSEVYDAKGRVYHVGEAIGGGGFGHVYKIHRQNDKSTWALKTLLPDFAESSQVKALANEGVLAMQVQHENVIRYEFFHDGSQFEDLPPYIIMEFAQQGTLRDFLKGIRSEGQFIHIDHLQEYFRQLISGMEAINGRLVHRDIKPENILISKDRLKISDFGLSKIVEERTRSVTFKGWGTFRYMAPEAWRNEKNTIQMDIYSMGVVFYELATLRHPLDVQSDDPEEWRNAHLLQSPQIPSTYNNSLTPSIDQMILKMIEKSPRNRFSSWTEVRSVLEAGESAPGPNAKKVDRILGALTRWDNETKKAQLAEQKQNQEKEDLRKIIKYQFHQDIVEPLKRITEDINAKSTVGSIRVEDVYSVDNYCCGIALPNRRSLVIAIRVLHDEDFYCQREISTPWGTRNTVMEKNRPLCNGQKILAWGLLKAPDEKGFNILLLERTGTPYGDWKVLLNTSSAGTVNPRLPEPFPFEFEEIGREIKFIGVTHVYSTKVETMAVEHFVRFIEESI